MGQLTRRYLPAQAVELIVEDILHNYCGDSDLEVFSEPWHNGRENGFCFWSVLHGSYGGMVAVFVAESRNSDDLTVTLADTDEWQAISEAQYRARERFPRGAYYNAALRVVELLEAGAKVEIHPEEVR
jgi:hypothetical protein